MRWKASDKIPAFQRCFDEYKLAPVCYNSVQAQVPRNKSIELLKPNMLIGNLEGYPALSAVIASIKFGMLDLEPVCIVEFRYTIHNVLRDTYSEDWLNGGFMRMPYNLHVVLKFFTNSAKVTQLRMHGTGMLEEDAHFITVRDAAAYVYCHGQIGTNIDSSTKSITVYENDRHVSKKYIIAGGCKGTYASLIACQPKDMSNEEYLLTVYEYICSYNLADWWGKSAYSMIENIKGEQWMNDNIPICSSCRKRFSKHSNHRFGKCNIRPCRICKVNDEVKVSEHEIETPTGRCVTNPTGLCIHCGQLTKRCAKCGSVVYPDNNVLLDDYPLCFSCSNSTSRYRLSCKLCGKLIAVSNHRRHIGLCRECSFKAKACKVCGNPTEKDLCPLCLIIVEENK